MDLAVLPKDSGENALFDGIKIDIDHLTSNSSFFAQASSKLKKSSALKPKRLADIPTNSIIMEKKETAKLHKINEQQEKMIESLQDTIKNLNVQIISLNSQVNSLSSQNAQQQAQMSEQTKLLTEMSQQIKELTKQLKNNPSDNPPKTPIAPSTSNTPVKSTKPAPPKPKPAPEKCDFPSLEKPRIQNPLFSEHAELAITPTPLNIPKTTNSQTRNHFNSLNSLNKQKTNNDEQMDTVNNARLDVEKTVPITIRDASKWPQITRDMKTLGCKLAFPPKQVALGIQVTPKSTDDHRQITKYLSENNLQYHTFLLPEEKMLNIFIRGINMDIDINDVKKDLEKQGFTPSEIYRVKLGRARKLCPIIKILLPKSQENIFNISDILDLPVKVESQKPTNNNFIKQCKKCQKFGHTEIRCFAAPVCYRCAGSHYYKNCEAVKTAAPVCCNCQGPHPASYSRCPKNPKNINAARTFESKKLVPGTSYANMTTPTTPTPTPSPKPTPTSEQTQSKQNQNLTLFEVLTFSDEELDKRLKHITNKITNNPILKAFLTCNA